MRYRLANSGGAPRRVRFFAALRPFQVTPPWQAFGELGGVSPIRELALSATGSLSVNGAKLVVPLDGAERLRRGARSSTARSPNGSPAARCRSTLR